MGIIEVKSKREKRIEQLKACGQTIIDRAEDIIGDYDGAIHYTVTIDIPFHEAPAITTEKQFISQKVIDAL